MKKPTRPFHAEPAVEPPPPGLAARLAAAAILSDVATQSLSLEDRLGGGAGGRLAELDARDGALVRSIATVGLRRLGSIRSALAALLDHGLPKKAVGLEWTLVAAAAQILYLDVPERAAVDLAVHAVKRDKRLQPFAALSNAVLRNLARERERFVEPQDPFADAPAWLAARWRRAYGEDRAKAIALAHRQEPTLDLTVKSDAAGWARKLGGVVLPTGSVRLDARTPVADLEGYATGDWWVQDAAASLPARLLHIQPGEAALDLCAAPGGKAAQLAAAGARLVALDRSAERLRRLAANFTRLGLEAEVTVADALSSDKASFPAVLLDAPCSATGVIRRHPDIAWTKRLSDVASLAGLQTKLIDRAVERLAPEGRLVYCVCSLEPEEGEAQIAALLRRNPDVRRAPIAPDEIGGLAQCITADGDLRTLPSDLPDPTARHAGMDGFFASRLVRRAG